jgi:2-dehydro-3-deoxyphosphogluconate aldolase / (4S)-4-hydroxy-2-oxoglutarate aldolase
MARAVTDGVSAQAVLSFGIVPVVVLEELDTAVPVAAALAEGGLPVAEVTFRTAVAADAIARIAAETDVLVGAGTVVRPEQVDEAVAAGAQFIVTPGLSARVIERCRELDVLVIPGVATATEVIAALDLGLDLLKLFPAEQAGGVPLLKALHGPFPHVRFVPTGGIAAANAAAYLALPSVAAVGGSWMVAPELVAAGDFATITRLTREAIELAAPVAR